MGGDIVAHPLRQRLTCHHKTRHGRSCGPQQPAERSKDAQNTGTVLIPVISTNMKQILLSCSKAKSLTEMMNSLLRRGRVREVEAVWNDRHVLTSPAGERRELSRSMGRDTNDMARRRKVRQNPALLHLARHRDPLLRIATLRRRDRKQVMTRDAGRTPARMRQIH